MHIKPPPPPNEYQTHPPFLIWPASMGIVADAPASALSMAYSVSDMVGCRRLWGTVSNGRAGGGGEWWTREGSVGEG